MLDESMDLSGAVDMLKEMLSGEEGQQTLGNILQMLGGQAPQDAPPGAATGGIEPENLEMVMRIQQVMSAMSSRKNSSQAQLLRSLKPFLKPSRRDKVDQAMQMLSLGQVLAIMKEGQEGG